MEKYQIERIVGRGAYGTVYLCKTISEGTFVIIKQIPMDQMSPTDRQATMNEVKVLAMLRHPNIIEYRESFLHERAMMIVMEYAAGGSLHDLIQERANDGLYLDEEEEIAFLFAQIILSMHHIHSNSILHRDLKAQNIFLTRSRNFVKVGDFGISKILTSKSRASTVIGTPSYISPELCEGRPYNQKSDIWSLGCVLYEMCALTRAFQAPTLPALVLKIMKGHYQPLPSHYSKDLKDLVSMMLELDPGQRPQLAHVMAHPWLAPHLYRLPTTLGSLPCTSKAARRPLSSVRFNPFESIHLLTSSPRSLENGAKRNPVSSALVSPSASNLTQIVKVDLDFDANTSKKNNRKTLYETCDQIPQVCSTNGGHETLCLTQDGKVLMLSNNWDKDDCQDEEKNKCRSIDSFVGIVIKYVVSAPNAPLICMLTHRGILITKGTGSEGCLGHGNLEHSKKPRIVEALLGEEITSVACSDKHVVVVANGNKVFSWGRNEDGCLGLGDVSDKGCKEIYSTPQRVPPFDQLNMEIREVRVGPKCSAVITSAKETNMYVCGKNRENRLLQSKNSSSKSFVPVKFGNVSDAKFGPAHSVILKGNGQVLTSTANKKIDMDFFGAKEMISIDTTCNREKPNFGVCTSRSGHVFKWKIDEKCDVTQVFTQEQGTIIATAKEHFIAVMKKSN